MFEWTPDDLIMFVVITVVLGFISFLIGLFLTVSIIQPRKIRETRVMAALAVLAFVVLMGAAQGLVMLSTQQVKPDPPEASTLDTAEQLGLKSGKAYPYIVGMKEVATDEDTFFSDSYLSTGAQPAPMFNFTHDDRSYVLRLAPRKVTIVRSAGSTQPTITLYLRDDPTDALEVHVDHPECDLVFKSLWATCEQPVTNVTSSLTADAKRRGLGPIVARHLDSATITLPASGTDSPLFMSGS